MVYLKCSIIYFYFIYFILVSCNYLPRNRIHILLCVCLTSVRHSLILSRGSFVLYYCRDVIKQSHTLVTRWLSHNDWVTAKHTHAHTYHDIMFCYVRGIRILNKIPVLIKYFSQVFYMYPKPGICGNYVPGGRGLIND